MHTVYNMLFASHYILIRHTIYYILNTACCVPDSHMAYIYSAYCTLHALCCIIHIAYYIHITKSTACTFIHTLYISYYILFNTYCRLQALMYLPYSRMPNTYLHIIDCMQHIKLFPLHTRGIMNHLPYIASLITPFLSVSFRITDIPRHSPEFSLLLYLACCKINQRTLETITSERAMRWKPIGFPYWLDVHRRAELSRSYQTVMGSFSGDKTKGIQ